MTGLTMDLFENLAEDHAVIDRTLDAFERMVNRVERDEATNREDLTGFITFFEDFADITHHDKEEEILMPALVDAGYDWYDGPAARLRREHRHERYLLRSLRDVALHGVTPGSARAAHFASVARTFVEFVRQHIRRESIELFPAAQSKLSPDGLQKLGRELERFNAELRQRVDLPKLLELSAALCERYPEDSTRS